MHRRTLIAALAVLPAVPALAQAETRRVRGTVEKVDGPKFFVKTRDGENLVLVAPMGVPFIAVVPATLADLKPGTYVGSGALPQPDGSLEAIEVHIFPESMRGTGEGHRPWDGAQQATMTNANIDTAVSAVDGSTLTLKLLCDQPIFAPDFGIYSHRINGMWLAGGASNSGGKVLSHFFSADEIARLSAAIDPDVPTGLDFYPLLEPGERFPVLDPAWPPRLAPRPADDSGFLQAMLEGISAIEKLGYDRLAELGAPPLHSMRSLGGGAANPAWTAIRQNSLGVPFLPAHSQEAAAGAARLALIGLEAVGDL